MLKQELLNEVLLTALSSGGDFAEVFCEHTRSNVLSFVDGKIDKINDNVLSGVGIRVFLGERTVYASTSDISREGLISCARSVADALSEGKAPISICLNRKKVIDAKADFLKSLLNPLLRITRICVLILVFAADVHIRVWVMRPSLL